MRASPGPRAGRRLTPRRPLPAPRRRELRLPAGRKAGGGARRPSCGDPGTRGPRRRWDHRAAQAGGAAALLPLRPRRLRTERLRAAGTGLRDCRLHPGGLQAPRASQGRAESPPLACPGAWAQRWPECGRTPGVLRKPAPLPGKGLRSDRGRGVEGVGKGLEGKDRDQT